MQCARLHVRRHCQIWVRGRVVLVLLHPAQTGERAVCVGGQRACQRLRCAAPSPRALHSVQITPTYARRLAPALHLLAARPGRLSACTAAQVVQRSAPQALLCGSLCLPLVPQSSHRSCRPVRLREAPERAGRCANAPQRARACKTKLEARVALGCRRTSEEAENRHHHGTRRKLHRSAAAPLRALPDTSPPAPRNSVGHSNKSTKLSAGAP
jgi:hypothetical protein